MEYVRTDSPSTPHLSDAWRCAFERELTAAVMAQALRRAGQLIASLERQGVHGGANADDVVQSALTAILDGTRAWSPGTVPLAVALDDHIRQTCRQSRRRKDRRPEGQDLAIDTLVAGDTRWTDLESALSMDAPIPDPAMQDLGRRCLAELTGLAEDDPIVLRVLEAMKDGIFGWPDIAEAIGLTPEQVDSARRRLRRLCRRMPRELLKAIRAAISAPISSPVPDRTRAKARLARSAHQPLVGLRRPRRASSAVADAG